MVGKKLTKIFLGLACGAILSGAILIGCNTNPGSESGRDVDQPAVTQVISEGTGGESAGEHNGRGGEGAGEHGGSGGEGSEGSEGAGEGAEGGRERAGESSEGGGEEATANQLAPNETFDMVRGGARLILNYDPQINAFKGTVENTTTNALSQVRIEVHLSNGTELGPTTPIDMAPGQMAMVELPSTAAPFTGWVAHAEVGSGAEAGGEHSSAAAGGEGAEGGNEGAGEGASRAEGGNEGSGGEGHGPGGEGGAEAGEAAMSSPITPLDQTWNGVLGGLGITARYDAATQSVQAMVQNTLPQTLCYVQAEPHLKAGATTVGELGPDVLGDLNPGQIAYSSLSIAGEPSMAGVAFDGYVVHMEVFDCGGPGPVPHTGGEGAEGSGGEGAGGEGGSEGTAEGSEGGGEEGGSANQLAPDETFDMVRSGARLILNYDPQTNAFKGTVENTTNEVLTRVRIEVHLSNGTELGPTIPINMAPGQVALVDMPSTAAPFTGWVAHAEVGGGEAGGSEGSGEHGGSSGGGESGGEHGSGGESGGEHGGRGEGGRGG